ncbi:MAG TPA: hypothetical protein PKN27_08945 [Propionibacteriaceae bacterium]|nr:hypothetical protein [Propionibacteriaceae bacterium]
MAMNTRGPQGLARAMVVGLFLMIAVGSFASNTVGGTPLIGVMIALILVLAVVSARSQVRTVQRRMAARQQPHLVVGPQGEVHQLGAPHAGYQLGAPHAGYQQAAPATPPQVHASRTPEGVVAARPLPRQHAVAAPLPARRATRPAITGSCLITDEWHPSSLLMSSLHRPD